MRTRTALAALIAAFVAARLPDLSSQDRAGFVDSFKNPAIDYYDGALTDPVSVLSRAIERGGARLHFAPDTGYLTSVLDALHVRTESQVVVFSQTSLQAPVINARNPRAIYFNDQVAVAWIRGAPALEIATHDPQRGVVFYALDQKPSDNPRLERRTECLRCHVSWDTFGVPGALVLSTGPDDAAGYATGGVVDHRSAIASRWGGWYVTGRSVPTPNMGSPVSSPPWLASTFDLGGYLTPHSDVVALMVLEHQARMMNLLTYLGWETRIDATDRRLNDIVREFVDYLLFVNEAPLRGTVEGSSAFTERFAADGPRDSRGRSLRQFDLTRRLMKYPCSYMLYSAAFDALPERARAAVYERMHTVLTGRDVDPRYARLSAADRQAIIEIVGETRPESRPHFARRVARVLRPAARR